MERMCERFPNITQATAELGMLMVSLCTVIRTIMLIYNYEIPKDGRCVASALDEIEHKLSMERPNGKHPRHGIPTRN